MNPNQNYSSPISPTPISKGKVFLGLVVSLILAFVAIFIPNLLVVAQPLFALFFAGIPFGVFLFSGVIFIILNFIAQKIFRNSPSLKKGMKWGYLFIIIVAVFSLSTDITALQNMSALQGSYAASSSGDVSGCLKVNDPYDKDMTIDTCLQNIHDQKPGDSTICDSMITDSANPTDLMRTQSFKPQCYDDVNAWNAANSGDISLCKKMSFTTDIDSCYQTVAIRTTNYSYCQNLSSPDLVQNCYKVFLLDHKTPQFMQSVCPLITNQTYYGLAGCTATGVTLPVAPTTNTTSTAAWQTYTSTQYGFSMKYPQGWSVTGSQPLSYVNPLTLSKTFGTGPQGYTCSSVVSLISTSVLDQNASGWGAKTPFVSATNRLVAGWTKSNDFPGTFDYFLKNTNSQYSYQVFDSTQTFGSYSQDPNAEITPSKNIYVKECTDIFSQMLSTFTFI